MIELHNQITYEGNGKYIIEGLSDEDTDYSFADIENSLLGQGFDHLDLDEGSQTKQIGLVDLQDGTCSIIYNLEDDVAELSFTNLSPTKEKVLDEALTAGHVPRAYSLREIYHMETDEDKEVYHVGTPELYKAWNK